MTRAEAALVAQSAAARRRRRRRGGGGGRARAGDDTATTRNGSPHVYERRDDTSLLVLFGGARGVRRVRRSPPAPPAARAPPGAGRGVRAHLVPRAPLGPRVPARRARAPRCLSGVRGRPLVRVRLEGRAATTRGARPPRRLLAAEPAATIRTVGCGSARFSEPLSRWRASRTTRTSVFQQSCFARYTTFWLRRCSRRRCAERPTRRAGSSRAKPSPPRTLRRSRRSPRWRWRGRAAPRCVCRWRSEVPSGSARRSTGCSRGSSITDAGGGGRWSRATSPARRRPRLCGFRTGRRGARRRGGSVRAVRRNRRRGDRGHARVRGGRAARENAGVSGLEENRRRRAAAGAAANAAASWAFLAPERGRRGLLARDPHAEPRGGVAGDRDGAVRQRVRAVGVPRVAGVREQRVVVLSRRVIKSYVIKIT